MAQQQEVKLRGIEALAKRYNTSIHSISRVKDLVKLSFETDPTVVPCMISNTGVGKTFVTESIARELDRYLITRRTANEEKEDSVGLPMPTKDGAAYEFLPHKDLREMVDSKKKGMVFIDEFNRGGPAVVKAYFNAVEKKSFGDMRLPDDTLFMVAMNPADSNYSVADIMADKALKKRFRFFLVNSDAESYLSYVKSSKTPDVEKGHPLVIEFLETYPQYVYDLDALENGQLFATPYHWSRISRACRAFDKKYPGWASGAERASLMNLIEGDIGSTLAEAFDKFVEERHAVTKPDDVLHNFPKCKGRIQHQIDSGRYDSLSELVAALSIHMTSKRPKPKDIAENICAFLELIPAEAARAFMEKLHQEALKNGDSSMWFAGFNRELTSGNGGKVYPGYARVFEKLASAEKSL